MNHSQQVEMDINTFVSPTLIITNFHLANQIASLQNTDCQWESLFHRKKDIKKRFHNIM